MIKNKISTIKFKIKGIYFPFLIVLGDKKKNYQVPTMQSSMSDSLFCGLLNCIIIRINCNLHQFLSCLLTLHYTTISGYIWLLMVLLMDQTSSQNNDRLQFGQLCSNSCQQQQFFITTSTIGLQAIQSLIQQEICFTWQAKWVKTEVDHSPPSSGNFCIVCFVVWDSHLGIVHQNVAQTKLVQIVKCLVCIQQVYSLSLSQDTNYPNTEFVPLVSLLKHHDSNLNQTTITSFHHPCKFITCFHLIIQRHVIPVTKITVK